jgi:hypothetical protein
VLADPEAEPNARCSVVMWLAKDQEARRLAVELRGESCMSQSTATSLTGCGWAESSCMSQFIYLESVQVSAMRE